MTPQPRRSESRIRDKAGSQLVRGARAAFILAMLLVSTGAQTLYTGPLTGRLGGADEERAPAAGGPEERVAVH